MEVLREMKINGSNLEEGKESEIEEAGVQVADYDAGTVHKFAFSTT